MKKAFRLIYFAPESNGGLADYAHAQANALHDIGVEVIFVAPPVALTIERQRRYRTRAELCNTPKKRPGQPALTRHMDTFRWIMRNMNVLADCIRTEGVNHVLFGSYFEYLAPIWSRRLQELARRGVVFGAVVHDPVRDFVMGPNWWHRWSIACGYSFLREAYVHEPVELDTVRHMPQLRTTFVPHGPYEFSAATQTREQIRVRLGIPPNAKVLLSFGHIRDSKNLELVLRAMATSPDYYLLVAGRELSAAQRPAAYYRDLAHKLGVADRCRWEIRHIGDNEVGNFFEASDLALLTYSAKFRSASGVLNAAVHFRKPCLASGGQGNLRTVVEKYSLGAWVNPDSVPAIAAGLDEWKRQSRLPAWDAYCAANSWQRNAELVSERMTASGGNGN